MNTKVLVKYTYENGIDGEISEYHTNMVAAVNAVNAITKMLGSDVTINSVEYLPVIKHIELAPKLELSQSDEKYSEVK